MTARLIFSFGLALFFLTSALSINAQQTFTFTVEPTNIVGNWCAKIDHRSLNNNPNAIIVAVPQSSDRFAVWYRQNAWHVCNVYQQSMVANSQFQIRFWTQPSANQFVHKVSRENLINGGLHTLIDNPLLNDRPGAAISIYQSISNERNDALNANTAVQLYNEGAKKWMIQSDGGKPFGIGNSYNIIVTSTGEPTALEKPEGLGNVKQNVANNLAAKAGGDLNGNYPNPNVVGLQGRPMSNIQPKVGDTLKWDGTQWKPTSEPQNVITATTPTTMTGSIPNLSSPSTVNQTDAIPVQQTDAMPAQQQVSAAAVKTYYQTGEINNWSQQIGGSSSHNFVQLRHNIQVSVKSRLIISAMINITGPICTLPPCFEGKGYFYARVDGNTNDSVNGFSRIFFTVGNLGLTSAIISNYMFDVQPGNHSIEFLVQKLDNTGGFKVKPTFSSIMVVPIE